MLSVGLGYYYWQQNKDENFFGLKISEYYYAIIISLIAGIVGVLLYNFTSLLLIFFIKFLKNIKYKSEKQSVGYLGFLLLFIGFILQFFGTIFQNVKI